MTDALDKEIEAIRAVLAALEPLDAGVRASVLDYVLKRLGVAAPTSGPAWNSAGGVAPPVPALASATPPIHIEAFKNEKQPKSANEMAALVAYYLANLVPTGDRKKTINAKDIETQFKIAKFPLPKRHDVTLLNAKAAGYFDSAGDGEFRLNAVGHNLVAHSMPRVTAGKATRKRRTKKNAIRKKAR